MAIDPISTRPLPLTPSGVSSPGLDAGSAGAGFATSLSDLLGNVDSTAGAANEAVAKMLDGTGDVHEAMIAMQRADLTLQLTVQIRNKLVQAYQDVMRMPI